MVVMLNLPKSRMKSPTNIYRQLIGVYQVELLAAAASMGFRENRSVKCTLF